MYIYERSDEQLIIWHRRATIIWTYDSESLDGRKAFALMDTIAQELNGRGYFYTFKYDNFGRWI